MILGDVLEHLTRDEAVKLVERARAAARVAVIASLPLGDYPQGEWQGNPHEAHLATWTDDDVAEHLHPDAGHVGPVVGTYLWLIPRE